MTDADPISSRLTEITNRALSELRTGRFPLLADIAKLRQLQVLDAALERTRRHPRWPIAVALLAVLLPATYLLFPVSKASIDIDATSDELRFRTTGISLLVGDGLELDNLSSVGHGTWFWTEPVPADLKDQLTLRRESGSIRLREIALTGGAEVVATRLDRSGNVSLLLLGGKPRIEVDIAGSAFLNKQSARKFEDTSLTLIGNDRPLTLTFRVTPTAERRSLAEPRPLLRPNLPISAASYWAQNPGQGSIGLNEPLRQSTILSGTLFLSDLKNEKRALRPYEELILDGVAGQIRSVNLQQTGLHSFISGTATRVETRSSGGNLELKPERYRAWAERFDTAWLALGGTLYVFGLILGIAKWAGWDLASGSQGG